MKDFLGRVTQGDCLEVMKLLPDNSIDLILTDPPYYKVHKEKWDNQWRTEDAFIDWIDKLSEQWSRILKPTGSLYCFAGPKMSAKVEVKLSERFNILNNIRWDKTNSTGGALHKIVSSETLKRYVYSYESIIFAESKYFKYEQLRSYLDTERVKANLSFKQVNELCNNSMACHYFRDNKWLLPTEDNYIKLSNYDKRCFTKSYEDLKDLCRSIESREFNLSKIDPYTSTWNYNNTARSKCKHVCEKPSEMLDHIINVSSKPQDVVLDCFSGGGSILKSASKLNRNFVGIEIDPYWVTEVNKSFTPSIKI